MRILDSIWPRTVPVVSIYVHTLHDIALLSAPSQRHYARMPYRGSCRVIAAPRPRGSATLSVHADTSRMLEAFMGRATAATDIVIVFLASSPTRRTCRP